MVVSRRAVWAAGVALAALAIIGAYQGWRRGAAEADVTAASDGMLPTTTTVAARQASALTEPSTPMLTEAQIRTIARQEAQAAIRGPAPAEPSEPGPAPAASRPTPAPDRPAPAAATPAAPAPAPAPAAPSDQAPPPPLY